MQRLASGFATLWVLLFVPSFIIWGLYVRASDSGSRRFLSTWHWLEDKLAYPLLFSPITDPAWTWFQTGSAVSAVVGFTLLIAVWAMIFTLPVIFVAGWWMLIVRMVSGPASASERRRWTPDDTLGITSTSTGSTLRSPMGALYLITVPLALGLEGLRRIARPFRSAPDAPSSSLATPSRVARPHPILAFCRPLVLCFLIVFVVQMAYFSIAFGFASGEEWRETLTMLYRDAWYEHLDTLRIPRLFETQFQISRSTILDAHTSMPAAEWETYIHSWFRHPELRVVAATIALRQALLVAAVFLVFRVIRLAFR